MSLNATNFIVQGPIKSADMKQFVDLFTGVMTDQPVTFRNATMVGGNQGSSTPPLKLFGVSGQTGNLIELYPTSGSANATFGFGALGNFAWGPGSPAANDTFLSRIALQNGHVTDTAGLLIDPYLEVVGNVKATGYVYANQASITGPTGTPFLLVINQDLTVNRNLTVSQDATITRDLAVGQDLTVNRTLMITNTNRRIHYYAAGSGGVSSLAVEGLDADQTTLSAKTTITLAGNAWYDGTNWNRIDTSVPSGVMNIANTGLAFYIAPAGTGAPAWVNKLGIDAAGNTTISGTLGVGGMLTVYNGAGANISGAVTVGTGLTVTGPGNLSVNAGDIQVKRADGSGYVFFGAGGPGYFGWDTLRLYGSKSLYITGSITSTSDITAGGALYTNANYLYFTDGNTYFLRSGTDLYYRATGHYFQNSGGSYAPIACGAVTSNSNVIAAGTLVSQNGNCTINNGSAGGTIALGDATISRWNAHQTRIYGSAGTDGGLTVAGQFFLETSPLYFQGGAANISWNGTYLNHSHSIQFNTNGNQIVWPNGSYISGNAGYAQGSSAALKHSFGTAPDGLLLDMVSDPRLPVSTYLWPDDPRRSIGFMADDVAIVLPDFVLRNDNGEASGYSPSELTAILWGAVRALAGRVNDLTASLNA